jgi:tRNA G18 (ribose-2'-O)-methylase SpoU
MIRIDSIDDERLDPYRQLKARELAQQGGRFIAEGEHVVRRLLASSFPTESVLLAERRVRQIAPRVPEHVPVYVASDALIRELIGYKFHAGALACALRGPRRTIDDVLPPPGSDHAKLLTLVICPDLANVANVGGMIRIAAAFGCDAMILGERSHDPFFRQSVRVSMGTIFSLPIAQSENLLHDLDRLRKQWSVQLAATVLDEDAEPLSSATRPLRFGLLFGNEAQGLPPEIVKACDRRITIPMKLGTDSLNVMVAAGIFLYHFTRPATVG